MRKYTLYISFLCIALLSLSSCKDQLEKEKWKITLKKDSKKPYGTYLSHNSLKLFFPNADVKDLSSTMQFSTMEQGMMYNSNGTSLMILTGLSFNVSEKEWTQLQAFAREGNEIIIFSSDFDRKILKSFNQVKEGGFERSIHVETKQFAENRRVLSLPGNMVSRYGYNGRSITGYFEDMSGVYSHGANIKHAIEARKADTVATTDTTSSLYSKDGEGAAMATDSLNEQISEEVAEAANYENDEELSYTLSDTLSYANGKPNCLKIAVGRGHITLHAAPLVMSNYFLLQDNNINYLASIWGTFPKDVNKIYWDDFFEHSGIETSSNALWNYESTRWALLLAFFVAVVYILFQMKRRQRIVPIVAPLRNDSVSFVETVGRLYYNTGNNSNLAEKMVQQYLEWVRMNCYLNTSRLNEEFVQQLAMKTGKPIDMVNELINMVHEVRLGTAIIDDAYLYQLYRAIQQFYTNEK
ncbi:hypothetical protein CJD36_018050 [Flavipsychrobacter stenotrophus]|uniref:DUF4350 domain-containing protein n=1 Tax=Flavipsychrobacter stenotrophus TaxID=2077091 RepID=A0A2S7STA2_9BACT|nr:DUF4350 domain-containing protein [Flavipsychrobacter stenotrophus]PQJ09827.1 hypothetical protein CJD36_018050 [Flavipsychrobacter stenotrophus]